MEFCLGSYENCPEMGRYGNLLVHRHEAISKNGAAHPRGRYHKRPMEYRNLYHKGECGSVAIGAPSSYRKCRYGTCEAESARANGHAPEVYGHEEIRSPIGSDGRNWKNAGRVVTLAWRLGAWLNTEAFPDPRRQLEQWRQCRPGVPEPEQPSCELEQQHRVPSRSLSWSEIAYLRVRGQCVRKRSPAPSLV